MSSYNFESTVSKTEANALKEMIFKRAKEHAEALDARGQKSFVDEIRSDIMDIARDSFVASKNPFSVIQPQEQIAAKPAEPVESVERVAEPEPEYNGLGFAESKRRLNSNASAEEQEYDFDKSVVGEVYQVMETARASLSKKEGFMGALNFLNSQAAMSLLNKKQVGLEIVA